MTSDDLRKLAAALREEAKQESADREVKMAHIVRASKGLALLKRKLGR